MTKTGLMKGMQCPKMLWLDKNKPELQIISPEIQTRLDNGNDFGNLAKGMFGPYKGMTVYRAGTTIPDLKAMIAKTEEYISLLDGADHTFLVFTGDNSMLEN